MMFDSHKRRINPQNEADFNLRQRHPDALDQMAGWQRHSALARAALAHEPDVAFGAAPDERMDIFSAARSGAPAVMFIHGGYWQAGDKRDVSFVASALVRAGITVVVNNYTLAPAATLERMVEQTARALQWLHRHAGRYGIDPDRLHVMGHSAGGHLAAMMLTAHGSTAGAGKGGGAPVRSAIAISGLFDLAPLVDTSVNDVLGLDAASAGRLSPVRLDRDSDAPLYTLVGADETEGFKAQARRIAAYWQGVHALAPVAGRHHYDVLNIFRDEGNPWLAAVAGVIREDAPLEAFAMPGG
ncbi:alpha/beta hydrolase [Cupriavidus taiwanensis]|uniref:alpha/beta hydrolase n=1 Tax=Cupriavidus taiwanensis TaxID=164546 RepID=UPI0025417698|nr:alpha/beta hydrolase [Cupriavidus taiwanensis]MDK3022680.1 alpha/beta hydrolase [Cupriavidus taiwanensis]